MVNKKPVLKYPYVFEKLKDEYRIGAEYRINRYLNNEDVNKISENVAGQLAEAVILHYENKNYLSDQIRNNIPKRNIEEGRESVRMFVEMLKKRKINVIDEAILNRAYEEEDYVDEKMLGLVLKALKIDEPVQYIPRYIRNMNAFHANGTKVVVVDELLEYTLISFLFTMYSLENNRSEENVTRCMKNFYVLEDLQNGKREIGTHNETQLYEMSLLPENLMHTAMDNYWTIWTF